MKILTLVFLLVATGCAVDESALINQKKGVNRSQVIWNSYGTYAGEPRKGNGLVNMDRLIAELVESNVNTYNWLVWHKKTDWEDLKVFLPLAREKGINVWVTIAPPSESPPRTKRFSEPFRLDFEKWGEEVGKLSLQESNLVALSIDDFTHNLNILTPELMKKTLDKAHEYNPKLAFVPCSYFPRITEEFIRDYGGIIDGILFPYRYESIRANLTDPSLVAEEVAQIKAITGPDLPIILDVYAAGHSKLGKSTPAYVEEVMLAGKEHADGVHIYYHQDKNKYPKKYNIIKNLFTEWAAEAAQ